jgi:hypothetical protein
MSHCGITSHTSESPMINPYEEAGIYVAGWPAPPFLVPTAKYSYS